MATAKSLRRQAATCATLAAATDDEESRERYVRLQQLYLHLAESEEPEAEETPAFVGDNSGERAAHRAH